MLFSTTCSLPFASPYVPMYSGTDLVHRNNFPTNLPYITNDIYTVASFFIIIHSLIK